MNTSLEGAKMHKHLPAPTSYFLHLKVVWWDKQWQEALEALLDESLYLGTFPFWILIKCRVFPRWFSNEVHVGFHSSIKEQTDKYHFPCSPSIIHLGPNEKMNTERQHITAQMNWAWNRDGSERQKDKRISIDFDKEQSRQSSKSDIVLWWWGRQMEVIRESLSSNLSIILHQGSIQIKQWCQKQGWSNLQSESSEKGVTKGFVHVYFPLPPQRQSNRSEC